MASGAYYNTGYYTFTNMLTTSLVVSFLLLTLLFLLSPAAADGIGSLRSLRSLGPEQHLSAHDHVVNDHGAWATAMNNLGIVPMGLGRQQLVSGRALAGHLTPSHCLHSPPLFPSPLLTNSSF